MFGLAALLEHSLKFPEVCTEASQPYLGRLYPETRIPIGVPRSKETAPPLDPTVGLCLGLYGGPGGGSVSYERGNPVILNRKHTPTADHGAATAPIPHEPFPYACTPSDSDNYTPGS